MSKEDAWPRWLNRALPKPLPGVAHDISLNDGVVTRVHKRTATGYNTVRVPGICRTCNNGWMSRLESAAAPLLLPMIRGQSVRLSASDQACVATWVTKTAIVFDQRAKYRSPFIGPDVTRQFGADRLPIPGSRVLLARYVGTDWTLNHSIAALPAVYRDGQEKFIAAVVTLSLGELTMQLISPTDLGVVKSTSHLQRNDARFALQLHPSPDPIGTWPPEIWLDSTDWYEFGAAEDSAVDIAQLLTFSDPPGHSDQIG